MAFFFFLWNKKLSHYGNTNKNLHVCRQHRLRFLRIFWLTFINICHNLLGHVREGREQRNNIYDVSALLLRLKFTTVWYAANATKDGTRILRKYEFIVLPKAAFVTSSALVIPHCCSYYLNTQRGSKFLRLNH